VTAPPTSRRGDRDLRIKGLELIVLLGKKESLLTPVIKKYSKRLMSCLVLGRASSIRQAVAAGERPAPIRVTALTDSNQCHSQASSSNYIMSALIT